MKKLVFLALLALGCPTKGEPAKSPDKKCETQTAGEIAAECALRVKTECVDKGVAKEDCEVLKECRERADSRYEECTK